ncbi:LacI family DNA-binding transcriptional regulator [Microbacterium dextranolyticum]|uniref:LacI family transcriptional regulator n=1 Tax=Microbacterium dextranolyticum TaxID=36806 RepID=A0A9W6M648_9MICO|nr:LacI family DNA-binding transcriptional regulator [Microbacterium dextranolyticum]MBM7464214.1 LacI family sucrose operon transcriptional repressor [Microbacterium dextranolyticum]GLJ95208.1 LacI family transcriptional regulator [Microbacterium dextranolyticum]
MARPKLQDVAARAGVSVTTVSRVLNNRGYLSDDLRRRVKAAIDELGYRPDAIARSLIGRKSGLVGVVVPTVADPFFGELVSAIERSLAEHGYKTLLCDCQQNAEREAEYLDLLQANRVDGIITSTHNRDVAGYDQAELPIVAVDRRLAAHIPIIRSDNRAGGRLATEHLLARGSRAPLLITATDHAGNDRAASYREVMSERGLEARVRAYGYSTPVEDRRALVETWLSESGADGVFATDDLTAMMALEWAHKTGRRVPDDVRVVGYDGSAAVRQGVPGLTTVAQPIERLGARAAEVLVDRIAAPDAVMAPEPPLSIGLRVGWTS